MAIRRWLVTVTLAASLLAGCGSSSKQTSSSTTTAQTPASASASSSTALNGIAGRLLINGELAGFETLLARTVGVDAASWAAEIGIPPSEQSAEAKRLSGLGFIAGLREHLRQLTGGKAEALSVVERFHTNAAAGEELAYQVEHAETPGITGFAVPGIPGARGFGGSSSTSSGINVAFAKGPYYYLVGVGWPAGTPAPVTQADVIAAAQSLYARVHA